MKQHVFLVPIDYSDHSLNALNIAISIAKKSDSKIVLLHSHDVSASTSMTHYRVMLETIKERVRKSLLEDLKSLTSSFLELEEYILDYRVTFGPVVDDIKKVAKEESVDLIVMGTNGRSNLLMQRFGSISSQIAVSSPCSVLVIPNNYETFTPNKIVLAASYHLANELARLTALTTLARAFKSEVTVLNVHETTAPLENEEIKEAIKIHGNLEGITHNFDQIQSAQINNSLMEYTHTHSIDLIAMVPSKHSLLEKLFHISHTEQMSMISKVPLLAIHD